MSSPLPTLFPLRPLAAALSLSLALAVGPMAQAGQPNNAKQPPLPAPPPQSLIQKLRAFLGLNPPVEIGGSRGAGALTVCLLSPWPGQPVGVFTPVIQAAGPLNEIRIEKNDQLLWQQRASSEHAIEGALAWPIRPLVPGEVITLRLRPRGASGGDFASFNLRAADAATMKAHQALAKALGRDPHSWYAAIYQLLPEQGAEAAALLSSPEAPEALRKSLACTQLR